MRKNTFFWAIGSMLVFLLVAFQEPILKKRITDKEFRYEFYVTDKEPGIRSERMYYWFKGGAIHNSENGVAGELLNGAFEKFYLSNQLAEKGEFSRGLKVGQWRTWYPNGVLETTVYWNEGRKRGAYYHYSESAVLLEKGRYSAGKKQGQWINFVSKDTIVFDKGEKVVKILSPEDLAREAKRKENKAKRKQKREEGKAEKKRIKQTEKDQKAQKKTIDNSSKTGNKKDKPSKTANNQEPKGSSAVNNKNNTEVKKESFFKRLFSKKKSSDGKSS